MNSPIIFGAWVDLSLIFYSRHMLLAIDGGSTKTIAVIFDDNKGEIISAGLGGSANYTTNSVESAISNLTKAINNALSGAQIRMDSVHEIIVSIVGIGDSQEATLMGEKILTSILEGKKYSAINDGLAAYYLGNGSENGIVFAPGTGSVGYIKTGSEMKRFGGWGWSIGDMSSATWFSKKAIEIAMMEMDSEQEEKPFLEHLQRHFKMPLRDIAWQVETRKMPKEDLASFSTNLSPMASSGNSEALSLYEQSAIYMGKVVSGIKRRYPDAMRVSIMGGTMQAGEFYYEKIRKHIPDVNIYFGYEIIAGAIMHRKNDVSFKFRDKLLEQLDSALRAIPEADLKKYLNIERPLHLP